jgi:putative hemolysin
MCWLIEKVRSDFLVLTHSALLRAPEARPYLLPVDFTGTKEAFETNLQTRDRARKHLAEGGCIVVFPAGAVSTAPDKLGRKPATDWPWQPFTAQLIQRSKATVVPIFFSGQNSRLFQIASHISATLRLSLIFKEVHDRIGTELPLVIGEQISASEISEISDRAALTVMLRDRTYALAERLPSNVSTVVSFKRSTKAEIAEKFRELVRKIDGSRARRSKFRRSA